MGSRLPAVDHVVYSGSLDAGQGMGQRPSEGGMHGNLSRLSPDHGGKVAEGQWSGPVAWTGFFHNGSLTWRNFFLPFLSYHSKGISKTGLKYDFH